jgi:hopanoid biosynthesis associated RND transporter like protein HpnN
MQNVGLLVRLVEFSRRHAAAIVLLSLACALGGALLSARLLGVTTDTDQLFAASLPWRQRQVAFDRAFPQFHDLLVVVIDAKIPEEADATAAGLAARLAADKAHFIDVRQPDASPFLAREGLLFLDQKPLSDLLNQTIDAQPFIGQLVADPSARGLFAALALVGIGVRQGQADLTPYAPALDAFRTALAASGSGAPAPAPLSWENLLAGPVASLAGKYRFVLVRPRLDYNALQPGGAATQAVRDVARTLEFVRDGAARVRITGSVALADDEFSTVAHGMLQGTIGSLVLITLWLFLAVGSWRLIVPIVLTLMLGLVLTVTFAAVAVGTLNLISVAFAILFIGIAVDFAIQFSVRFREAHYQNHDPGEALALTTKRVGRQIAVAAAATACGFLAFVPTDFVGVAELGLIAGVGMGVAFLATMVFLPAALTLFHPRAETAEIGLEMGDRIEDALQRIHLGVLSGFAALALAGAVLLPFLTFDSDPLHTKNPNTESMQTLADLANDPLTNPYSIDIMTPNLADAAALAERLRRLPTVADVLSLQSYVPTDQPAKLALINDAAGLLSATLTPRTPAAPLTPDQIRLALRSALSQIEPALPKVPAESAFARLALTLKSLLPASDDRLMAMNAALTRFLPMQLGRLRLALTAQPVTAASVPPDISRDWVLPDGRARVQVLAKPQAQDSAGLAAFVDQVQHIAPDAGGTAVTIEATSRTIIHAFRSAAIYALLAITGVLYVALRDARHVALVLAPLLLSALMTVVVAVALPMPLNFANIIALPLLLGVGVSFNIYFVMNWRDGARRFLGSATARAVAFSALTTGTAFGSLALSGHPGTASMGHLLLLSLGCTLIASLIFVPTLLRTLESKPFFFGKKNQKTFVP